VSDLSDPSSAGRGDRRRARKAVDAAYAEGRITAADRALRLEQIDAAATRGDLAMVLRDLEGRVAPTTSTTSNAAPVPTAPPRPEGGPPTWAPPGYGSTTGPGPRSGGWSTERKIGCGVAVVIALFLVPLVVAVVVFVGVATSFDDDFPGFGDGEAVEVVQVESWWTAQVDELRSSAGSTRVAAYRVRDGSGTATVLDGAVRRAWAYRDGSWRPVGAATRAGAASEGVDLADVTASAVQRAVDDAVIGADGPVSADDVGVSVEPEEGGRLLVDLAGPTWAARTVYDLDGEPVE
jgi:hypothetical protein